MTIQTLVLALGLVLVFEGLVFVLAPHRMEDLLRVLAALPPETRRLIGFLALVLGVGLIISAQMMAGS